LYCSINSTVEYQEFDSGGNLKVRLGTRNNGKVFLLSILCIALVGCESNIEVSEHLDNYKEPESEIG
jgi:hypothetical protein